MTAIAGKISHASTEQSDGVAQSAAPAESLKQQVQQRVLTVAEFKPDR